MNTREEERRIAKLLNELISLGDLPVAVIESRLGWEPEKLSALLVDGGALAIKDLLQVLALLNTSPADFFTGLYSLDTGHDLAAATTSVERKDRRFEESRRVVTEAIARRAAWKKERAETQG